MHERGDVTPACVNAQFRQLPAQHARPHERMLKMQFVQAAHERQISGTGRLRQIINRASADLQQFRLARDGQIVVTAAPPLTSASSSTSTMNRLVFSRFEFIGDPRLECWGIRTAGASS